MKTSHWFWPILFSIYLVIGIVIYSPSLGGPWQYDDHSQILDPEVLMVHPAGRFFWNAFRIFPEDKEETRNDGQKYINKAGRITNRDVARATFRLNWDWWGDKPLGYRWTNLIIHVVNSALVAWLCWNLLSVFSSRLSDSSQSVDRLTGKQKTEKLVTENRQPKTDNRMPAFFAGLLFLIHPINSQAVAYIAQRFTSMATMFYLGAVILFIFYNRYKNYKYYILSLLSAILAYSCKEITITLPAILFLIAHFMRGHDKDYSFYNRYKGYILLLPFLLLALKIPFQQFYSSITGDFRNLKNDIGVMSESAAMKQTAEELTRKNYFLTEINVVRTYLRLLIWPVGQTIDWDYGLITAIDFKTALTFIFHLTVIISAIILLFSRNQAQISNFKFQISNSSLQLIGAGLLWFYITLLPESSVIPIIDVIYEHRTYLPMVGVCIVIAVMADKFYNCYKIYKSYILTSVVLGFLILSAATFRRAWVWGDQIRLWQDAVVKSPDKARPNKNYGVVLAAAGKYEQGIRYLKRGIELDSDNADYHSNLGTAYLRAGLFEPAAGEFQKAFDLYLSNIGDPNNFSSKDQKQLAQYANDNGVANVQLGRGQEAVAAFEKALAISPGFYSSRLGLGAAYNVMGKSEEAIEVFSQLVKEYPSQTDAYNNLAVMYEKTKKWKEAYTTLLKLQSINSNYPGIGERMRKLQLQINQSSQINQ